MSFILLVIGMVLFFMGRIRIGALRAEGRQVKAAGVILTLPALLTLLLLNFVAPPDFDALMAAVGVVSVVELAGMLVATGLAYILIADPPNAPRLPGILGQIQEEARQQRPAGERPLRVNRTVTIPGVRARISREPFPAVMDLKDAARYLRVSEAEILQMIEDGRLAASRDNFSYKIARSQLDELR